MNRRVSVILNTVVTAFLLTAPVSAQDAPSAPMELDELFERLQVPELAEWEWIEQQIERRWSSSGSPAMDLLLQRGRDAMEDEDYDVAIQHYSALIDHAPEFAEGYNARATAFFAKDLYGPALEDVKSALALEPRHFNAWQGLGILMREMGQTDLAVRAFREAASIHPNNPQIKEQLERLEQQLGEIDA